MARQNSQLPPTVYSFKPQIIHQIIIALIRGIQFFMPNPSETKNLVILYQKLFNVALKRYRKKCGLHKSQMAKVNIRSCSSINSFKTLLMEYPKIKEMMEEMFESGQMLETLVKWRGQHCNMAISLKYLNRLYNIVKCPEAKDISWSDEAKGSKMFHMKIEKKDEDSDISTIGEQTKPSPGLTPAESS